MFCSPFSFLYWKYKIRPKIFCILLTYLYLCVRNWLLPFPDILVKTKHWLLFRVHKEKAWETDFFSAEGVIGMLLAVRPLLRRIARMLTLVSRCSYLYGVDIRSYVSIGFSFSGFPWTRKERCPHLFYSFQSPDVSRFDSWMQLFITIRIWQTILMNYIGK